MYIVCCVSRLFLQHSGSLTRLFNRKPVDTIMRWKENAFILCIFCVQTDISTLQHMVTNSVKMSFQWHTRTLLTWDFDHELSRCTYAGDLQRAPQRAPAGAKQWWVLGCWRGCANASRGFAAMRQVWVLSLGFPSCSCCGWNQCRGGGRCPSHLQGGLPASAREGGLTGRDRRNRQRLDVEDSPPQVFYHYPGMLFSAGKSCL